MKCSVPQCKSESVEITVRQRKDSPPPLDLCLVHQRHYRTAYAKHCRPLRRPHGPAQQRSWQATWMQMVGLEMLHSGNAIGVQRGHWATVDGVDVWVPEGTEAPRPSYPGYPVKKSGPLPEHATRAGQAAIAKRVAEQELLERKLAAETADFMRGHRQVLELELKVKRAAETRRKKS